MPQNQATPLTIRLYDAENEPQEFSQTIIPWGIMKMAIAISENMNQEQPTAADIDALAGLVVAVFGNRFSTADLDRGADITEMMAVINAIVARATNLMPGNPTLPG